MARRKRSKGRRNSGTAEVERLIALAAEPVPPRSGIREYGRGPCIYAKTAMDGSVRVFRFHRHEDAQRAMAAGVAADDPLARNVA